MEYGLSIIFAPARTPTVANWPDRKSKLLGTNPNDLEIRSHIAARANKVGSCGSNPPFYRNVIPPASESRSALDASSPPSQNAIAGG